MKYSRLLCIILHVLFDSIDMFVTIQSKGATMSKVIRIPKELKVSKRIDRNERDIKATEYAASLQRNRVSLAFEMLRKSTLVL